METTSRKGAPSSARQHKRTASSVLKSIIPRNHQSKPCPTTAQPETNIGRESVEGYMLVKSQPMLPPDHPHTRQHLREESGNRNRTTSSPKKSMEIQKEDKEVCGLHKGMTRSASFKSAVEKEKVKATRKRNDKQDEKQMKKSKSSTSLSALLSRPRSSKGLRADDTNQQKDKENRTPPSPGGIGAPPIWAQFTTQGVLEPSKSTQVPLNDCFDVSDEMALYTPRDYLPSKQTNFYHNQPTLSQSSEPKPRPESECVASGSTSTSLGDTVSDFRGPNPNRGRDGVPNQKQSAVQNANTNGEPYSRDKRWSQNRSAGNRKFSDDTSQSDLKTTKRGSRVMAAVAAFNGKAKEPAKGPSHGTQAPEIDPRAIETAFESLLDARNVPQNTRDKMRSLDTNIKADFIEKNKTSSGSASSADSLALHFSRPISAKRSKTDDGATSSVEGGQYEMGPAVSPKKSRPRSLTFTFSKGDQSPSKKQKSERPVSHQRTKSGDLTPSGSSKSLTYAGEAQASFFSRGNKPAVPEDFISYLRKVQRPEAVEVGKIHKLRQLLRNETVGWVDEFTSNDGMTELVALLYRIIGVEWREEHEDTLLHETLLCLKALSTTSSALRQLSDIQATLFPTLLKMLFDQDKKGPSEFTTRTIIFTLLSTYLAHSSSSDLASRARTLLSYLRDPAPPEEAQPLGFIASIYHPRPYRVWTKELSNVTKEVFWIFLHHTNIIPYPQTYDASGSYISRHFPCEHPPVPAAPYIGGVEWDATNYFTAHMDLLNGLIASLPTQEERNQFRQELKDSGFEKVMGTSLRTCKEKLYGGVHEALTTWVGAAMEDGWPYQDVRQGPKQEDVRKVSPKKSPKKKEAAPKLDMPRLDLGGGYGKEGVDDGGWL